MLLSIGIAAVTIEQFVHLSRLDFVSKKAQPPLPSQTDLYFPPQYAEYEAAFIPNVKLVPIQSVWGHIAGLGINATDNDFLNKTVKEFLK